jgi:chloride channel protein, CIC family
MTDIPASATAAEPAGAPADEARVLSLPTLVVLAFVVGVVAALGAVTFRAMIAAIHNVFFLGKLSFVYDANIFDPPSPWGPFIILAPIVGGLIVVWLVNTFAPEAKGHGVPEVMYAVYHNKGNVRGVVAIVKSIASAISIGSGASVGREGPIIQIGASFGSTLARKLSLARWQKITLLSAGAGAGIAATFNTPLGGVLFAVELLLPEVSNRTFLPVVVATTTATSISRVVFGLDPAFFVPDTALPGTLSIDPLVLGAFGLLGAVAGVVSWAFIRFLAWCEDFFPSLPGNAYTQNIVGMLLIGVLFYGFELVTGHPQTAGVGYATIQSILEGGTGGVLLLVALVLGKLVATSISLGAGASGGVFSPSLFIGAALGATFGALGSLLFPDAGFSVIEFAVVGMGAIVGGATGASMTAIVMIFEMTRDYNVIVPLVLAVALSTGVRRALITENIYTIKLRHRGRPIPTIRHTNMYLVRQARELMNTDFIILPKETSIAEALAKIAGHPGMHIIVSDGPRIAGVARLAAGSYVPDRLAGQTLASVMADDFVVSPDTAILNTIISRMNRRDRGLAIVVDRPAGIPRPENVVGVIAASEIANAVIANHYA